MHVRAGIKGYAQQIVPLRKYAAPIGANLRQAPKRKYRNRPSGAPRYPRNAHAAAPGWTWIRTQRSGGAISSASTATVRLAWVYRNGLKIEPDFDLDPATDDVVRTGSAGEEGRLLKADSAKRRVFPPELRESVKDGGSTLRERLPDFTIQREDLHTL